MCEQMNERINKELIDLSDNLSFRFALKCFHCNSVWESDVTPYSRSTSCSYMRGKRRIFHRMLWKKEYLKANERAINQAAGVFNLCPMCKRLVCNECLQIRDDGKGLLCVSCCVKLGKQGKTVGSMMREEGWVMHNLDE